MKPLLCALLLLTIPGTVIADEYACHGVKASGLKYDSQRDEWMPTTFLTDYRYRIQPGENSREPYVVVIENGDPLMETGCKQGFSEGGILQCDNGIGGNYSFNRNNMRLVRAYTWGYWNIGMRSGFGGKSDADSNPVFVEISTCSKTK